MSISKLDAALKQVIQSGSYATCRIVSAPDDQRTDFWYFMLVNKNLQFPGTYCNIHGELSATFLLDPALKSLDVQALFTLDNKTGDITSHFVGHGKLHLPGIGNSSGLKYGIVDIELSVAQFVNGLPTGQCPVAKVAQSIEFAPITISFASKCDCGGKKLGYRDDELHGHGQWCKLVKEADRGTKA